MQRHHHDPSRRDPRRHPSLQRLRHRDPTVCIACGARAIVVHRREARRVCTECGAEGAWVAPTEQTFHESSFNGLPHEINAPLAGTLHVDGALRHSQRRLDRMGGDAHTYRLHVLDETIDAQTHRLQSHASVATAAKRVLRRVLALKGVKRVKKDALLCSVCVCFASRQTTSPYSFRESWRACATTSARRRSAGSTSSTSAASARTPRRPTT